MSFWHAGGEILRSKSLDRNSYDSGDWFNRLDFSYQTNGFGRGLPPKTDNEAKWPYMRPLLADPALAAERGRDPGRQAAGACAARRSGRARRCSTSARRNWSSRRCHSPAAVPSRRPGVIVMRIDDTVGPDVDPRLKGLVVVFNASDEATTQTVSATAGQRFALHPAQAGGGDRVVKSAKYVAKTGQFIVPARTVAVFVRR